MGVKGETNPLTLTWQNNQPSFLNGIIGPAKPETDMI